MKIESTKPTFLVWTLTENPAYDGTKGSSLFVNSYMEAKIWQHSQTRQP